MSNRILNLETYKVENIKKDMVKLFDSDYNGDNGVDSYEIWEQGVKECENEEDELPLAIELGFENEAERFIDNIYSDDDDDITNINAIMQKIVDCWGSHVDQYKYNITTINNGEGYIISVAYMSC